MVAEYFIRSNQEAYDCFMGLALSNDQIDSRTENECPVFFPVYVALSHGQCGV